MKELELNELEHGHLDDCDLMCLKLHLILNDVMNTKNVYHIFVYT